MKFFAFNIKFFNKFLQICKSLAKKYSWGYNITEKVLVIQFKIKEEKKK